MRDLISSLLESERLAAGAPRAAAEPVDLAALVREVVAGLRAADAVTLQLADGLPPVLADPRGCACCCATCSTTRCAMAPRRAGRRRLFLRRPRRPLALGVRDHGPGVAESSCAAGAGLLPPRQRPHAGRAAWAWACTCAGWWRRRTAANCAPQRQRQGWRWRCGGGRRRT
jgi:hypothetical protein